MRKGIVGIMAVSLAACQTAPPNTPGAGSGDAYTPVVDMQGLDMQRYATDLDGCRAYARQINPNKMAMESMLGGIIVGALVGAAVGGNRNFAQQGALAGGGAGVAAGGARGVVKQETIMANCMAGRGYRVLDATVPTNTVVASPYVQTGAIQTPSTASPPATWQPSSAVPGCGWEGYVWRCAK